MRRADRQAGFTMTELMVVILVSGLTLAAGLPAMGRFLQTERLEGAAKQMTGHIRLARQKAVAEDRQYLFLWWNTNWYYIIRDDDGNGYYTSGEPYQGPIWLPRGILTENATGFTTAWLRFAPNGSCSDSGTLDIVNSRGKRITLTLLGPTGQVYLSKETGS